MRIAVMGTGAVGGYFGAKLAAAGHEVAFVARGRHLEAMQRERASESTAPMATCTCERARSAPTNTAKIGAVDLVLFCVKSYDTEAAAEATEAAGRRSNDVFCHSKTASITRTRSRDVGDAERILAGVVYVGAQIDRTRSRHPFNGRQNYLR